MSARRCRFRAWWVRWKNARLQYTCMAVSCVGALVGAVFSLAHCSRWAAAREMYIDAVVAFRGGLGDPSENRIMSSLRDIPPHGCVFDIGAHNGIYHSNSFYLIHTLSYTGRLYEPSASAFSRLVQIYRKADNVKLFHVAVTGRSGTRLAKLHTFPTGLENSLVPEGRSQFDNPGPSYWVMAVDAAFICDEQRRLLAAAKCGPKNFTVLSIDAEGHDQNILFRILDPSGGNCSFDILIAESSCRHAVEERGFEVLVPGSSNFYNTVYRRVK